MPSTRRSRTPARAQRKTRTSRSSLASPKSSTISDQATLLATLERTNTLLASILEQKNARISDSKSEIDQVDLKQRPPSKHGPDAPTIVFVSVCILDLPDVDSAACTFDADFYVVLDWEDPRIQDANGINLSEVWNPGVSIINAKAVEEGYKDADRHMAFSLSAPGKIRYEQRYTGTLTASMLLHRFPFDQQVLNIILEPSFCMVGEIELVLNANGPVDWDTTPRRNHAFKRVTDVNDFIDNRCELSEWKLVRVHSESGKISIKECRKIFDSIDTDKNGVVSCQELKIAIERGLQIAQEGEKTWQDVMKRLDQNKSGLIEWGEFCAAVTLDIRVVAMENVQHYLSDDTRWSRISLRLAVVRQWKFYAMKVCSILIFISILALPMFRLGQHELEARINLLLTLFLSATAFQFVVGESLPKVGYLTYMDQYIMAHNILLVSLTAEAVLVHMLSPTAAAATNAANWFFGYNSDQIDDAMTVVYVITLLLINGIFFGVGSRLYVSPEAREAGLHDD